MKKNYLVFIILFSSFLFSYSVANAAEWPSVKIDVMPKGLVQPGQLITLRAAHENFSTQEQDKAKLHFNWCIDDVPLHGKIAGSDDKIKGDEGGYYLENKYGKVSGGSGACRADEYDWGGFWIGAWLVGAWDAPSEVYISRTPHIDETGNPVDTDRDGLDDDWELRYFAGRKIPETSPAQFYPSADDKAALLAAVKPEDDPDKDGFEYTYNDYKASVHEIEDIPIWSVPWTIGIPYVKNNMTGDKKWTNMEEYVAGTDPLNPDTDQDGIFDEADFAGNQQDQFTLRVNKDWGGKYKVKLYAFGITQRWRDDKDEWKYDRADFPNKRTHGDREKTPENANIIMVGQGLPLQTNIGYSPAPPLSGDPVQVTAEALQIGELKGLNIFFRWFLDGVLQKSVEGPMGAIRSSEVEGGEGERPQSGYGKKTFQFQASKKPCERHVVGVEIVENKTGKMNYNEVEIPIGFRIQFKKEILGNADLRNEAASKFNLRSGTEAPFSEFLLPNDQMKDEIDGNVGFRQGDIVRVTVMNLEQGYDSALCGEANFEEFLKTLTFRWNFKGIDQQVKSGIGGNFSSAIFVLQGSSRSSKEGSGTPAENTMEGSSEPVSVEIRNKNGDVIARFTEEFKIIPPYIDLAVEGADLASSAETTAKPTYQAKPGDDVKITAKLHYFRPSAGFTYTWKRNGEIVNEMKDTDITQATYSFKAGLKPDGSPTGLKNDVVTLDIENKINTGNENEKEFSHNNLTIELVTPQGTTPGAIGAALQKFVPKYYKSVFNLALGGTLMAMAALLVLGFMRGTEKK